MSDRAQQLDSLRIDPRARGRSAGPWWIWIAAIVLLAGAGVAVVSWVTRIQAASVTVATVTELTGRQAGGVLNASGYVTARRRATVSSKVTGKVVEVRVEEGMRVREGDVLARLDDSWVRADLALAKAELAGARRAVTETEVRLREATLTLQRTQQLFKEGIVEQASLDRAEAEVESLKARLASAIQQIEVAERQVAARQTELHDMIIRAPFDGVAISKDAQPGEMVSPVSAGGGFTRTGISTIVDMSSLEIEVDVNESYITRVHSGQKVTAVLDAYPDWPIPAHVITTVPAADRQKATVLVRIGFDRLDPRILPDMGVKVTFLGAEAGAPAAAARPRLVVPKSAIRGEPGRQAVFVVREDRAERRAITVGDPHGDQVEVVAGLSAGERVIVQGPPNLAHGDRVVIR